MANSELLHEAAGLLKPATLDRHRAIASLMEELEHAAMVLQWLRRHNPMLDEMLRSYLFSAGAITALEAAAAGGGPGDGSLGISSLDGSGAAISS